MNLIGKILVVIVTVMSIAFLGVAISLYATHNNWKATIEEQTAKIAELNTQLESLQTQYAQYDQNLDLELSAAEQQIRKLERERVALVSRNEEIRAEIENLQQQRRDNTTVIAATQAKNAQLASQNDDLEQDIDRTLTAMNNAFQGAVEATSELHEAKIKLETELERNAQLLEQVEGIR